MADSLWTPAACEGKLLVLTDGTAFPGGIRPAMLRPSVPPVFIAGLRDDNRVDDDSGREGDDVMSKDGDESKDGIVEDDCEDDNNVDDFVATVVEVEEITTVTEGVELEDELAGVDVKNEVVPEDATGVGVMG